MPTREETNKMNLDKNGLGDIEELIVNFAYYSDSNCLK